MDGGGARPEVLILKKCPTKFFWCTYSKQNSLRIRARFRGVGFIFDWGGGGGGDRSHVLTGENWTKLVLVGNVSKKITCATCTANGSVRVVSVSSKPQLIHYHARQMWFMNTAPQFLKHERKARNLNLFVHVKIVIIFNLWNLVWKSSYVPECTAQLEFWTSRKRV